MGDVKASLLITLALGHTATAAILLGLGLAALTGVTLIARDGSAALATRAASRAVSHDRRTACARMRTLVRRIALIAIAVVPVALIGLLWQIRPPLPALSTTLAASRAEQAFGFLAWLGLMVLALELLDRTARLGTRRPQPPPVMLPHLRPAEPRTRTALAGAGGYARVAFPLIPRRTTLARPASQSRPRPTLSRGAASNPRPAIERFSPTGRRPMRAQKRRSAAPGHLAPRPRHDHRHQAARASAP